MLTQTCSFSSRFSPLVVYLISSTRNSALLSNPERLAQISVRIPAGRWATPEDFAGPTVFLASEASNYVCGELLLVDGGWMGR